MTTKIMTNMTAEQLALRQIRAIVDSLNDEDKLLCWSMAQTIRNVVAAHDQLGPLALGLVGAELAVAP